MSFKQYLKIEIAKGLDETYVLEGWAKDHPGRAYYDVHLSTIERHETATPVFRRCAAGQLSSPIGRYTLTYLAAKRRQLFSLGRQPQVL